MLNTVIAGDNTPAPFIEWAEAHTLLMPLLKTLLPDKNSYINYAEPFLGRGNMLFHLNPKQAIVNDNNSDLISAYQHVKFDAQSVIRAINKLGECPNRDFFDTVKEEFNYMSDDFSSEKAAMLIWLVHYSFNHLYRTNKQGQYNGVFSPDSRSLETNKNNLLLVNEYMNCNSITITNQDYLQALDEIPKNSFVFLDPPKYIPLGERQRDNFSLQQYGNILTFLNNHSADMLFLLITKDMKDMREMFGKYYYTSCTMRGKIKEISSDYAIYSNYLK